MGNEYSEIWDHILNILKVQECGVWKGQRKIGLRLPSFEP